MEGLLHLFAPKSFALCSAQPGFQNELRPTPAILVKQLEIFVKSSSFVRCGS